MEKIDIVEYDIEYLNNNKIFSTNYDNLFQDKIKNRGIIYYHEHKVKNISNTKNKITAIVNGIHNYNVEIEFLANDLKVKCDCPYHKDTDIYCKHIYAVLITLKIDSEKERIINIYNTNINRIKEIKELIDKLMIDNKSYLHPLDFTWITNIQNSYDKYLKEMNDKYDINNIYRLIGIVRDSYYHLNNIIEKYNSLIDEIEENKKELEKNKEEKADTFETTTQVDDTELFNALDDVIASVPLSTLKKVREDNIKNGESNEIIDKAIKERKRRDKIIKRERTQEYLDERKARKEERKMTRGLLAWLYLWWDYRSRKKKK